MNSTPPLAPSIWPIRLLVLRYGQLIGVRSEHSLDRFGFGRVAQRRAGAVRVDVLHFVGIGVSRFEGLLHRSRCARSFFVRRRDMESVGRVADAQNLGVDRGAAFLGVLVLLEHDDAGSFAQDETVAILVERPAGGFGRVIPH